jgi:hypothetical protein
LLILRNLQVLLDLEWLEVLWLLRVLLDLLRRLVVVLLRLVEVWLRVQLLVVVLLLMVRVVLLLLLGVLLHVLHLLLLHVARARVSWEVAILHRARVLPIRRVDRRSRSIDRAVGSDRSQMRRVVPCLTHAIRLHIEFRGG